MCLSACVCVFSMFTMCSPKVIHIDYASVWCWFCLFLLFFFFLVFCFKFYIQYEFFFVCVMWRVSSCNRTLNADFMTEWNIYCVCAFQITTFDLTIKWRHLHIKNDIIIFHLNNSANNSRAISSSWLALASAPTSTPLLLFTPYVIQCNGVPPCSLSRALAHAHQFQRKRSYN